MNSAATFAKTLFLILLALLLQGCPSDSRSGLDEERDPHYLVGESRESSLDYQGAAEAYEKALENNPRNVAAHKKLGFLHYQRLADPSAAIYHFERVLRFRPNDDHADTIKQFIALSKQELARTVSLAPLAKQANDELNRLTTENGELRRQVDAYRQQLTLINQRVASPVSNTPPYAASVPIPGPGASDPSAPGSTTGRRGAAVVPVPSPSRPQTATLAPGAPGRVKPAVPAEGVKPAGAAVVTPAPAVARSYTVRSGDTLKAIATRMNLTTRALILANPNLDPRRIKPGQVINLPPR